MAKTAEDWAKEMAYEPDIKRSVESYKEFAAQEVEAFKDKLRTAIMYADDDGSSRYREGMKSVLDLIDIVK
jgi:hypothetical protein